MNRDEIFEVIARAAGYSPKNYIGVEELDRINDAVNIIDAQFETLERQLLEMIANGQGNHSEDHI